MSLKQNFELNKFMSSVRSSVVRGRPKIRIPINTMIPKTFCCDDETGEVVAYQINGETGEPSIENHVPFTKDTHIQEPGNTQFTFSKSKKLQALVDNMKAGANTTSYRLLLLIPTLMIFPSLICVMLIMLEIYLHVRCHKKNKKLVDSNLYYRSPFHIVTRIFCGVCRETDMACKVGHLQDKRRHHYDYFRRIAI